MTVPIPARCAHRPQAGGLVVPAITLRHPHAGWLLGQTRSDLMTACIRQRRCQVCGQPLEERAVVACRPIDITRRWTAEPPMHPECATYAAAACPMLNGRMTHHRARPLELDDHTCDAPACTCRAWRQGPDLGSRAGQPADDFLAVWLRASDIHPDIEDGKVRGLRLRGVLPLRTRAIPAPHRARPLGQETRQLLALDDLRRLLTAPIPTPRTTS